MKPLRASSQNRSSEYSADSPTSIRVRCTTLRPRVNAIPKSPTAFVPGTMRTIPQTTKRSVSTTPNFCLDSDLCHGKRGHHSYSEASSARQNYYTRHYAASRFYCHDSYRCLELYFSNDQSRYLFRRERDTSSKRRGSQPCLSMTQLPTNLL